jgi:hypothetical protein
MSTTLLSILLVTTFAANGVVGIWAAASRRYWARNRCQVPFWGFGKTALSYLLKTVPDTLFPTHD